MTRSLPTHRAELLEALEAGETFEYLTFWGHRQKAPDGVDESCLSQWYPAEFEVHAETYATAEHWMMAEKARLFGDSEIEAQILSTVDPGEAKALGRRVRGYVEEAWAARRLEAVIEGNMEKFGQNPALREFLLGTGDRVLVEAAPRDPVWGVGLGAERAEDPTQWRGLNLLGFALMITRARLRSAP